MRPCISSGESRTPATPPAYHQLHRTHGEKRESKPPAPPDRASFSSSDVFMPRAAHKATSPLPSTDDRCGRILRGRDLGDPGEPPSGDPEAADETRGPLLPSPTVRPIDDLRTTLELTRLTPATRRGRPSHLAIPFVSPRIHEASADFCSPTPPAKI